MKKRWLLLLLLLPLPLTAEGWGRRLSSRAILALDQSINSAGKFDPVIGGTIYSPVTQTLTEATATSTHRITVAAEAGTSGVYLYNIYATDGSTPQVLSGRVLFSATADGATETCVLGTPEETDNTPTGTLTVVVSCSTTPTNGVYLQLAATSSLTQTVLQAQAAVILVGPGTATRVTVVEGE